MSIFERLFGNRPAGYHGKYRGVVESNLDPQQIGRLRIIAPQVTSQALAWALPCLPGAGPGCGLFLIPPVGANVWVEFEQGDLARPIWSGGWWSSPSELPDAP